MECKTCKGLGDYYLDDHKMLCADCNGTGETICPCEQQSKDECQVCNDSNFLDIIKAKDDLIRDLRKDNELMKSTLYIIRTAMGAYDER